MADYPYAQWFQHGNKCRDCGKPAGTLMSYRNAVLGYFCEAHAKKHINAAHRKGQFAPDAFLAGKNE